MSIKYLLAATLVGGIGMTVGQAGASAQSVSVLGISPMQHCAEAAAAVEAGGKATDQNIETCNQVVHGSQLVPVERAVTLLNRGVLHLARSENELAIADFDGALKISDDLAEAYDDRAIAESALHRYPAAEADFSRALALKPAHPEMVYFNRAMTDEDAGDMKQAYLDYRAAATANPAWDKPAKELARFTVAHPAGS